VEAAFMPFGIRLRDSKQPAQQVLTVSAEAWTTFLAATSSTREAIFGSSHATRP
jgi:hypothetical protein